MSYTSNAEHDAIVHTDAADAYGDKHEVATRHAEAFAAGGDAVMTQEGFSEFLLRDSHQARTPLLSQPMAYLAGPVSDAYLLMLLLTSNSNQQLATVAREIRARYLADQFTRKCIDDLADRLVEGL